MSNLNYKGIDYRVATKDDIIGLTLFLSNVSKENDLVNFLDHDIPLSAGVMRQLIEEDQGVILIAEKNDKIVGAIVLGRTTLWWAKKEFLTNLALYVDPEYRKFYNIQGHLLELTKTFADEAKLPILLSLFDATDKKLKVLKYLNYKGYQTIGVKAVYLPKE